MLVLMLVLGLVIGIAIFALLLPKKTIGDLCVDQSDPDDNPYLFLELKKDMKYIYKSKYVVLKVNTKNYISHK